MNGILVINKEKNMTSRDVVNKLNHILGTKKIGHTGTLDPIATGVLVCTVGYYTKLGEYLTSSYKEYVAEFVLGYSTDTFDITGKKVNTSNKKVTLEELNSAIKHFKGKYSQTVPSYSAVKIDGKKLYEYAREGVEINLPKREVDIKEIELLSFENDVVKIKCLVSKGTYIRSLINDIGKHLGCFATMSELARTKQGKFVLENSYSLKEIEEGNYKLLTFEDVLDLEEIDMNDDLYKKVNNGVKINNDYYKDFILFKYNNDKIALYKRENDGYKMFIKIEK